MEELNYIVISELPREEQEPLKEWLTGQTVPKLDCCFVWDYQRWKQYWQEGKTAPIND